MGGQQFAKRRRQYKLDLNYFFGKIDIYLFLVKTFEFVESRILIKNEKKNPVMAYNFP